MKRLAMLVLLAGLAVGCVGKNGGGRGLSIQRTADTAADHDRTDLSDPAARPIGLR